MSAIQSWLRKNKEGMIIGALVGFLVYSYMVHQGADFMTLYNNQAIFDKVVSSTISVQEVVKVKAVWIYMAAGTIVGGIIDALYKPNR